MPTEKDVKHLVGGANCLSSEKHVHQLLKSYYITHARKILEHKLNNTILPMCTYCSRFWNDNSFQLKLLPQLHVAKKSKQQKLIAKLKEVQSGNTQTKLTKKQKNRAKWLLKKSHSQLQIHCDFCEHTTKVALEKPKTKKVKEEVQNETKIETTINKTKKKKIKDVKAGLKLTTTKITNVENTSIVKGTENVSKETSSKQTIIKTRNSSYEKEPIGKSVHIKNTTTTNASSKKPTVVKNVQKVQKSKQNLNKKIIPPTTSKTQQKNAFLQLAEMLKKQNQTKKSTTNPLEVLMK